MNRATNALAPSKTGLPQRPMRRLAASCFAVFTVVATAAMPLPAYARSTPESFADLAAEVTPAVVNISASTTVEARNRTLPQLPPGTPFEDLFEEFFNRRGQGGRRPRRQRGEQPFASAQLEFARLGIRHRSLGHRGH